MRKRRQNSGSTSGANARRPTTAQNTPQKTYFSRAVISGVGTNRPVGRNNNVRISTTDAKMIDCDGLTQSAA